LKQRRGRIYFSKSKEEIEKSGTNTKPEIIPGSGMWAYTNDNTPKKMALCEKVLRHFKYSFSAVAAVKEEFSFIEGNRDLLNQFIR
jgi:negative modulator of initiation of replication